MPVIEVQRDSATRTPVQPQTDDKFVDQIAALVGTHGANNVFVDGVSAADIYAAAKTLEPAATGNSVEPPLSEKKKSKKGGAA